MAILNDVTRLFDGLPNTGDTITPHGSGDPPEFGKMQDAIQIDLGDETQIAAGDLLHWQGKEFAVTQMHLADLLWESMNTGLTVEGEFSYIVQLVNTADPGETLTIWLPMDGQVPYNNDTPSLPLPVQLQGTAASLQIRGLTPVTSIPWDEVDANDNIDTICFAGDTLIETAEGPVAASALRQGDRVRTKDASFQPIRWVAARQFSRHDLDRLPHLRPIRIAAGTLGAALPTTDLLVSPQHRILVRSPIAQRMFDAPEVLVAAKQLVGITGIASDDDADGVTYVHFLFDAHQIVYANGAEAESLYTGQSALRTLGHEALSEIRDIFPETAMAMTEPTPARPLIRGREGRKLAERHQRNDKPLYA